MFIIVLIQILCTVLQQTCVTSSLRHPLCHPLCHLGVLGVPDGYLYARTPAGHFCVGEEGPLSEPSRSIWYNVRSWASMALRDSSSLDLIASFKSATVSVSLMLTTKAGLPLGMTQNNLYCIMVESKFEVTT